MNSNVPSRRDLDSKEEVLIGSYLDKEVYPSLAAKYKVRFERQTKKEIQLKGVDLIAYTEDGKEIKIDEKAQLHYVNSPIETCAFEINSYQHGQLRDGWLYDTEKVTDRYFYITHILLKHGVQAIRSADDFRSCKIFSLNRTILINTLEEKGITKQECLRVANENPSKKKIKFDQVEGAYLMRSGNLNESPLNLIIRHSFLLELDSARIQVILPF